MRLESKDLLELATQLPVAELPFLLGELETIRASVAVRLASPAHSAPSDTFLDIKTAAARLNVSTNYLYRHSKRFPFVRRIGSKLLFSSAGLEWYMKTNQDRRNKQ